MIASLPMYDRPETAAANDALWSLIRNELRGAGVEAPVALTRDEDLWAQWTAPDLVLSQTCGMPLAVKLKDRVTYVGSPVYDIDCPPGYYFSALVARKDDPRSGFNDFSGACLAYNDSMSQSGWGAPHTYAQVHGVSFGSSLETGSHRASARAVADGRADIAALDAVTWKMIQRWDPYADTLRLIGETPPTPSTPYIAALGADRDVSRQAMHEAIAQLSGSEKSALCLKGIVDIPIHAYDALKRPPKPY